MNHTTRKWSLRAIVVLYLGVLVGLPVAYLFIKAFSNGFHAFWVEVTKPNAIAALKLSAEVALIAVPVNTVVGVGAALLLAKRKFFGSRALQVAFDIPVAVSPIIIGVALILAYSRIGWFGTLAEFTRHPDPVLAGRHRVGHDGRLAAVRAALRLAGARRSRQGPRRRRAHARRRALSNLLAGDAARRSAGASSTA